MGVYTDDNNLAITETKTFTFHFEFDNNLKHEIDSVIKHNRFLGFIKINNHHPTDHLPTNSPIDYY